jgi:PAS domain S-box-containing protein
VEAVQAERQRFNDVLNMLPAYVALLSPDYRVPFANRFFEERFGESKGRRCYEYLFGRTEPCEDCQTFKVLKTNAPHRWEWTGPDGRNYDIHDYPFTDVDGSPLIMEVGVDITERKRAEAALQEANANLEQRVTERTAALHRSERRYRSFVEVTNQFAWVTDPDGQVVEDVPALRQFTGQTYEQARGAGWSTALHLDDLERTLEVWNRAVATRTQYETEYRMRRHDGVYRLLLAKGVPIVDERGNVAEWVGTCVDITERKQAELNQALATSILRVLNRDAGDLHFMIKEVLRLIRESTGFDAVGLRLHMGDDYPYYEQDGFSDDFLREENFLCEKRGDGSIVRCADGRAVLECTCGLVLSGRTDPSLPFFTEGGSFWTNISSELLALTPDVDPRTNPRNRCIHAGYQSVALIPVRSREEIIGLLQLNDRRQGRFEPEVIRFLEGLADNIGLALKRKQAEEALAAARISAEQAKAAAEEANRAKDRFLAVLSHELRTPLTPVLAAVSMLQRVPVTLQARQDHLELIRRNVELEARLIDDLLDLNRIARGKVELDKRPVDLCTVVSRAVEVCRPDIEARQLQFSLDAGPGSYTVDADAARLQQVFWNLFKNAIKFTPQGGGVTVRCCPDNQGMVIVEVSDSGAGISPEAMPRIFDAFAQADRAITRQFGGLGLGLAISKSLVELHGGTIEATSAGEGKGSMFSVRLPLLVAMEPASLPTPLAREFSPSRHGTGPSPELAEGSLFSSPSLKAKDRAKGTAEGRSLNTEPRRLRILVAEDHADAAEMIRLILETAGHQVKTAGAVATAIQAAEESTFDLLISDLGLPDGSGLDLIRELRAKGHNMPAVALSGYGQDNDIQQSRAAGFATHLIKPVDMDRLMAVLSEVSSRAT